MREVPEGREYGEQSQKDEEFPDLRPPRGGVAGKSQREQGSGHEKNQGKANGGKTEPLTGKHQDSERQTEKYLAGRDGEQYG